jgi:hypothetical protein
MAYDRIGIKRGPYKLNRESRRIKAGQTVARLTAIKLDHRRGKEQYWLFKCDCGAAKVMCERSVRRGQVKSCGCLHSERTCARNSRRTTHGHSNRRLGGIFYGMLSRCHRPSSSGYAGYGGRGISVCDLWRNDPCKFIAWALANGYEDELQIDRRNNDADYSPENCRWVTRRVNGNNKRNNHLIEWNGHVRTAAEWGRITGLTGFIIIGRLRCGWPVETALTAPVNRTYSRQRQSGRNRKLG